MVNPICLKLLFITPISLRGKAHAKDEIKLGCEEKVQKNRQRSFQKGKSFQKPHPDKKDS
jgi:hypothetical protein